MSFVEQFRVIRLSKNDQWLVPKTADSIQKNIPYGSSLTALEPLYGLISPFAKIMPGKYVDNPACGDKVTSGGARPFYRAKPNNRTWDKKTVHEHRAHTIRYAVALCNDYIEMEYR